MRARRPNDVSLLLALFLGGCGSHTEILPAGHEAQSQTSPDGLSRAFVWMPESSGTLGATNSQPYQVWIQYLKVGHEQQLLLKAAETDGLKLSWTSPGELQICYGPTYIYHLQNYFDYETEFHTLYHVEVLLNRAKTFHDC